MTDRECVAWVYETWADEDLDQLVPYPDREGRNAALKVLLESGDFELAREVIRDRITLLEQQFTR